jgi:hypothetical protein
LASAPTKEQKGNSAALLKRALKSLDFGHVGSIPTAPTMAPAAHAALRRCSIDPGAKRRFGAKSAQKLLREAVWVT